ncbi:hypothetical protein D7V21_04950 [Acinetobacter guerrae]|uniref:Uncharacterized protein n=1 Tax=Acinetobacter guerrae TaxID=1843371 RepID=A0A3A8EYI3_9GAMM|nr:hypothetical protein [Acinetobacter guerrae]RKG35134.1 hypothetical protein D7V21_04950 [Acinetobacter guerrae]
MPETNNDIFQIALKESVHFSVKTINSNIEKGGLRLSKQQALDLTYLSARTLLKENFLIPTDYQANAGKTASIFKVVKAAMLGDDISSEEVEFQQQVKQLQPHIDTIFDEPYQAGTDDLDIRMRQLLIPKNGEYISISPLTAAGVNYLINQEVDFINETRKEKDSEFNRIQTAVFGIGGANPQNVGSLVRSMQRPITLDAPKNDQDARVAFKIFHSGFDYYIPNKILIKNEEEIIPDIILWSKLLEKQLLATAQNEHQKWHSLEVYSPETNVRVRRGEMKFLKKIFNLVNYQGQQYLQLLKNMQEKLPVYTKTDEQQKDSLTPFLHPDVPFIKQGLIVPELRDDIWRIEFANDLAENIIGKSFMIHPDFPPITLSLDENAKGYLARRLREIVR